jgi:hypothetical protein
LTAGVIAMNAGKVPIILSSDREAVAAAIRTSGRPDLAHIQLARIENTLRLEYILASVTCLSHIRPGSDIEVISSPFPFGFEPDGSLTSFANIRIAMR